jgi:hypothetical protein
MCGYVRGELARAISGLLIPRLGGAGVGVGGVEVAGEVVRRA